MEICSNLIHNFTEMRFALRAALGQHPWLYFALQHLRPSRRHLLVTKDTEIVIEGYPRSANTFAVVAFLLAQGHPVKIAHHLHVSSGHSGCTWNITTIVIEQESTRCCNFSLGEREPRLSIEQALKD